MRRIFTAIALLLMSTSITLAQTGATNIAGNVKDDAGDAVIAGTVSLYKGGALLTGVLTDFDGNYNFANLDPGTYDIEVSYVGYSPKRIAGVVALAGRTTFVNVELSAGVDLDIVEVIDYKVPLIEQDNTTRGGIKTGEEIRNLPTKNINALAATTAGLSSQDEGKGINVRGSREGATNYYIDGIRVSGALPPETEIDQLQVITGGFPAEIGDITGGGISITSRGASSKYTGQVELETSEFLDAYGYNMFNGSLSGPLIKKPGAPPILGFRLSARVRTIAEDGPTATGVFVVKDEVLENLKKNPVQLIGSQRIPVPTAEQLTNKDVELRKARPNERETRVDLTGKLDFRFSKNIDLSVTGTYFNSRDQFTPSFNNHSATAGVGGADWSLLNYQNNPTAYDQRYRILSRFRHRLGGGSTSSASAVIQNAQYYLQFGWEHNKSTTYDPRHKDRLFDYGHVGSFGYEYVPVAGLTDDDPNVNPLGIGMIAYSRRFTGYDPTNSRNPGRSLYNGLVAGENPEFGDYVLFNGITPTNLSSIYGYFENVHSVYDRYQKGQNDTYTFTGGLSFDLMPGGSAKGRHTLALGAMYEQRDNRFYAINPERLWVLAGLRANTRIVGLDYDAGPIGTFTDPNFANDTFFLYAPRLDTLNPQFYRKIREKLGIPQNQYVEVDMLDPSILSLDMFSSDELTDQPNILNYYGYDYLGNLLGGNYSFEDFFRATDANNNRTFPVAPWRPTYLGMWIQDKFTFKDIIFRVGLRADRYDANTKVMKDPYSLYEIMRAKDYYATVLQQPLPENIDPDYKVYTGVEDGKEVIQSFRKDDQWYFPNGAAAPDGRSIYGTSTATPYFQQQNRDLRNIKSRNFDVNSSFEDYKSKLFLVPRLAFSFPISDDANFFANYDVLISRPTSNTIVTALQYYYFEDQGRTPANNPNLQPEKTIVYEVGFQQKLTNTSALRLSAYYRELRDLIQRRTILYVPAPVSAYDTYGNIDFGTVKAFTIEYDLRRTNNVTVQANYTLQFADGTGSDANSQQGLTNRGLNIRTLFPFSYDERHTINLILDYRYQRGKKYNGPRVYGRDILADAGINIQTSAVSGRPYTRNTVPTAFGGAGNAGTINGDRLPWRLNIDLRIDKRFDLTSTTKENPSPLWINAYLRIQNVFNIRNTLGVYSVSGSPDDSGYLVSTFGQSAINTIAGAGRDTQAFLDVYSWAVMNPGFFNLPRRILLGAILEF